MTVRLGDPIRLLGVPPGVTLIPEGAIERVELRGRYYNLIVMLNSMAGIPPRSHFNPDYQEVDGYLYHRTDLQKLAAEEARSAAGDEGEGEAGTGGTAGTGSAGASTAGAGAGAGTAGAGAGAGAGGAGGAGEGLASLTGGRSPAPGLGSAGPTPAGSPGGPSTTGPNVRLEDLRRPGIRRSLFPGTAAMRRASGYAEGAPPHAAGTRFHSGGAQAYADGARPYVEAALAHAEGALPHAEGALPRAAAAADLLGASEFGNAGRDAPESFFDLASAPFQPEGQFGSGAIEVHTGNPLHLALADATVKTVFFSVEHTDRVWESWILQAREFLVQRFPRLEILSRDELLKPEGDYYAMFTTLTALRYKYSRLSRARNFNNDRLSTSLDIATQEEIIYRIAHERLRRHPDFGEFIDPRLLQRTAPQEVRFWPGF